MEVDAPAKLPATDARPQPAGHGGVLPLTPEAVAAGDACVHCGLCLPACPTYLETGDEGHSPRGRIRLMLGLHRGDVDLTPGVRDHLDACLDCRACETACPSGVEYHTLIEDARQKMHDEDLEKPNARRRLVRSILLNLLTKPRRLRWALLPARVLQKLGLYGLVRRSGVTRLMPSPLRRMESMLDAGPLWPKPLPARGIGGGYNNLLGALRKSADGDAPAPRVGLLVGCVGQVMFSEANRKAAELLAACGADVIVPPAAECCGALHHHAQAEAEAEELARRTIDAFLPENDPAARCELIATTIAGCGAMLKDYGELLRDDPAYADRANQFVSRVRDVTEVIAALGPPPMRHEVGRTLCYHDACHLAHGQGVTSEPRELLAAVPGLTLVPLAESDICCGAAGSYNLLRPEMADRLADRKLDRVAETGAGTAAMGNVGCAMHLKAAARRRKMGVQIVHPVEVLHEAVFGPAA